jgi:hypothetical protein
VGNPEERNHLEDIGANWWIILKCALKKQGLEKGQIKRYYLRL